MEKTYPTSKLLIILGQYILPVCLVTFITSIFYVEDTSQFKSLFYALILLPVFIAIALNRRTFTPISQQPILISVIIFLTYSALSVLWSDSDRSLIHYFKRELYILALITGFSIVYYFSPKRFHIVLGVAITVASAFAGYFLFTEPSLLSGSSRRIFGGGALYNPLLSAHVFGFFWALCVAAILEMKRDWKRLLSAIIVCIPLTVFILMTQSRTPIMAMTLMLLTYIAIHRNYKALSIIALISISLAIIFYIYPEILTNRGLSYRPYIWQYTLNLISQAPFLGIGIDNTFSIPQPNNTTHHWADPHNIHLAVLLYTGIIGLLLWVSIYWQILKFSLFQENTILSRSLFLTVIFGASAALTEGEAFFSRPKEQWFIIWIPIALLIAVQAGTTLEKKT